MSMSLFPDAPDKHALERGEVLAPRFDTNGLMAVVTTHAETGEVLMFAWMNAEALARTLELGEAVYFSRSRNEIWHKGATSGQIQKIVEMRIDCDQDCLLLKVLPQGDGGACHVGFRSCFYRVIEDGKLVERP
ncbi:phosphoribosyl-AMP cyclohydrolase [Phenylobacterium aquaticum]|uniref:phosphoribosyl-AMP cyclohydrolase n=1 Tax=Phenylobacterium aquaticum TaxID=1763816 RepID=UPI001F5D37BC|nr:phosphoribosyl-AMP cyclohydrolase [Phenylobacterium aquaticum]MCI3132951.1 phosphoribosyl-AMP cyclohydrolase [Phenylobacterium aquaticum]